LFFGDPRPLWTFAREHDQFSWAGVVNYTLVVLLQGNMCVAGRRPRALVKLYHAAIATSYTLSRKKTTPTRKAVKLTFGDLTPKGTYKAVFTKRGWFGSFSCVGTADLPPGPERRGQKPLPTYFVGRTGQRVPPFDCGPGIRIPSAPALVGGRLASCRKIDKPRERSLDTAPSRRRVAVRRPIEFWAKPGGDASPLSSASSFELPERHSFPINRRVSASRPFI